MSYSNSPNFEEQQIFSQTPEETKAECDAKDEMREAASSVSLKRKRTDKQWEAIRGLLGEVAEFIWKASPYPMEEVAIGGAVAYLAGICGRAYNVNGMGLNEYVITLAETGFGKNGGASGIDALNNAVKKSMSKKELMRIGPGGIPSQQGLTKALAGKKCCLSLLGEIGIWFQELYCRDGNPTNKGIQRIVLDLFTKSGGAKRFGDIQYSDSTKDVPEIFAPAWSFLGDSTQVAFYKSINEYSITEGLVGRLMIFEYPEDQPVPIYNPNFKFEKPSAVLVQKIVELLKRCNAKEIDEDGTGDYNWYDVPLDQEATSFDTSLEGEVHAKKVEYRKSGESHLTGIWMRLREKTLKLAALIAVGNNPANPIITSNEMVLARSWVNRGNKILVARFQSGRTGDNIVAEQTKELDACLKEYTYADWDEKFGEQNSVTDSMKLCGVVTYGYIMRKLHKRKAFERAGSLRTLVDEYVKADRLQKIDGSDPIRCGKRAEMWLVTIANRGFGQ